MPFAMLCGRGPSDLVDACDGPTVEERHAALLGGQMLDEPESRMLAASPVAQFGAGMLATAGGMAALAAWAATVALGVDGLYIAIDHDVLDADDAPWAVTMPEPLGLSLDAAEKAVRTLAAAIPVVGLRRDGHELRGGRGCGAHRRGRDAARDRGVLGRLTPMSSISHVVSAAFHKVVSFLASLLPSEPSDEPEPPDIDGRRPSEIDTTRIEIDIERKDGKGGYR